MHYFETDGNQKRGTILIDVLTALTLAMLFIAVMTSTSIDSRALFERAKERNLLLNAYEAGDGVIGGRPYGNDRIQTDFEVVSTSSILRLTRVLMRQSSDDGLIKAIGTPLCSVDFLNGNSISVIPITLSVNPLLPLTDFEVRNGIAYISADSSIASDPDVLIVDIRNSNLPIILSSINTGPGIASIALAGKRIYAAASSAAAQLHIIRLDGLNNPILEKKFKLPLPYATATPALASSIFYSDGNIYLGAEKWDGDEFDVLNSSQSIKISGLEIGSKVSDIFVRNDRAYIANASQLQLIIADVQDPAHPMIVDSFSPSGWSRQEGKTVSSFEDALNFGRTAGGYNIIGDHEAFAWASTSSTTLINPVSIDIPGGVYGIIADRFNIYLATRQTDKELQIFDRNFTTSTSKSYSLPIAPQAMTCDGDRLYILAHTAPVIYEITFKN